MKFSSIIKDGLNKSFKFRKSTKPTKASQKKRVEFKKKKGELKKSRKKEKIYQVWEILDSFLQIIMKAYY